MGLPTAITPDVTTGHVGDHIEIHALLNSMWANVMDSDYAGGAPATVGADSTDAIQAAIDSLPASGTIVGGTVFFPPGAYEYTSLSLDALHGITFLAFGNAETSAQPSVLRFTGSDASSAITFASAVGIRFSGIRFYSSNAAASGYILDGTKATTDTNGVVIEHFYFSAAGTDVSFVKIGGGSAWHFRDGTFVGGKYHIDGGTFSNSVQLDRVSHFSANTMPIWNPSTAWTINSPVVEPLASGAPGFIGHSAGWTMSSIVITNPYMEFSGDHSGSWITFAGKGLTITGGSISMGNPQTSAAYLVTVDDATSSRLRLDGITLSAGPTQNNKAYLINNNAAPSMPGIEVRGLSVTAIAPGHWFTSTPSLSADIDFSNQTSSGFSNWRQLGKAAIFTRGIHTPQATAQSVFVGLRPNLLTDAEADFEDGGTPAWQNSANTTLTESTSQALHGTHSLSVACSGGGDGAFITSRAIPVSATTFYTFVVWVKPGTTERSIRMDLVFHDNVGGSSAIQTVYGSHTSEVAGSWTQLTVQGTAPTGAVSCRIIGNIVGPAAESHYFDQAMLVVGAYQGWNLASENLGGNLYIDSGVLKFAWPNGTVDTLSTA